MSRRTTENKTKETQKWPNERRQGWWRERKTRVEERGEAVERARN
jgi:hypothetical protein